MIEYPFNVMFQSWGRPALLYSRMNYLRGIANWKLGLLPMETGSLF